MKVNENLSQMGPPHLMGEQHRDMDQTLCDEVIEFWSFIPLFIFFNSSISGFQDASAQVTEGLVLRT